MPASQRRPLSSWTAASPRPGAWPLLAGILAVGFPAVVDGATAPAPDPDGTRAVSVARDLDARGWFEALRDLRPDPARGAVVEGLTITRDVGVFHLDRGTVHALAAIDGRTVGVVFSGTGRFTMQAPEAVEQAQLRRGLEEELLEEDGSRVDAPFRNAVFLFTDFTLGEIEQTVAFAPLEPEGDAGREAEEARDYFTDGDGWIDRKILLPLANGAPGFFYAHFSEDRGEPLIFSVDPYDFEEVSLAVKRDRVKRPEVVAQFHRQADYATGRSIPEEALDLLTISAYDVETEIRGNLDIVGRTTVSLERRAEGTRWVPFRLFSELEVDSVSWGNGNPAAFYRPDDASDLWVDFADAPAGDARLTFHYDGDLMDRINDLWIQLGSHTTWFPVYEFGRVIPYTLTFHAPDDLTVTTVGRRTSAATEDGVTTTTWETGPVRMVTFNVGDFDLLETEPPEPGAPGLSILINEGAHRRLADMMAQRGRLLLQQEDMAEMVALDLRASFAFFNDVYGPTTVTDFVATEIPYSHGEAYPGLVMLAWNTFQWTSSEGFDEMFRAHEVAHQWWGIGVRPATYRDWWLAEGFSEFSGWWYAARARGSVDMYFRRLEATREAILDRRDEAGPIALGQRAGTSRNPADYALTVYHKSAWVLHMLRTLMTDYDTGNDDAFTRVMSNFYTRHLGGVATTASFQQVVEEELGGSMDWFFQQWVYGTAIPTYTFAHRYEDTPAGQVRATVRIRQEDVPDDFRMFVPVHLDFGEEGSATVRVLVAGPETVAELPLLPRRPESIEFNPFESVLAETRTEDWDDGSD